MTEIQRKSPHGSIVKWFTPCFFSLKTVSFLCLSLFPKTRKEFICFLQFYLQKYNHINVVFIHIKWKKKSSVWSIPIHFINIIDPFDLFSWSCSSSCSQHSWIYVSFWLCHHIVKFKQFFSNSQLFEIHFSFLNLVWAANFVISQTFV